MQYRYDTVVTEEGSGREALYLIRHQRKLHTFDNTLASREVRVRIHSRSALEGSEHVLEAGRRREVPRHSHPVNDYTIIL